MEQQRLNYLRFNQNSLRMLTLFWRMTDILRVGGRARRGTGLEQLPMPIGKILALFD